MKTLQSGHLDPARLDQQVGWDDEIASECRLVQPQGQGLAYALGTTPIGKFICRFRKFIVCEIAFWFSRYTASARNFRSANYAKR